MSSFFSSTKGRPKGSLSTNKKSAFDRLRQFSHVSNNGLIVKNNLLYCLHCCHPINHERKSTVKNHLESSTHRQKTDQIANTPSVVAAVTSATEKSEIWDEMTKCFLEAGVPLHVFSNQPLREWIRKYVRHGETLPCIFTLRNRVKALGNEDTTATKEYCRDKDVAVIVDETTDIKNRKVVNVLVAPLEPAARARLVLTKFVEVCDNVAISNAVLDGLQIVEIKTDQVVQFKTDNAKYMVTAAVTLKGICPRMVHSTCWSHVLHLQAEEIRSKLSQADTLIANLKAALVKAPSRRQELLNTLEQNGCTRQLPPFPVITRWCTWLQCGEYIFDRFDAIVEWIIETEENSVATKKLMNLIERELDSVRDEFSTIHRLSAGVCTSLRKLEGNDLPACDVWLLLLTLNEVLQSVGIGATKLKLYMDLKHPAKDFWQQVQYFDPRKINQFTSGIPPAIAKVSKSIVPESEVTMYKIISLQLTFSEVFDVSKFWHSYKPELPTLYNLAIKCISCLTSTSDVERSFSSLRRILTPLRTRFSEENLGIHLRLGFNRFNSKIENDTFVSWDDDI